MKVTQLLTYSCILLIATVFSFPHGPQISNLTSLNQAVAHDSAPSSLIDSLFSAVKRLTKRKASLNQTVAHDSTPSSLINSFLEAVKKLVKRKGGGGGGGRGGGSSGRSGSSKGGSNKSSGKTRGGFNGRAGDKGKVGRGGALQNPNPLSVQVVRGGAAYRYNGGAATPYSCGGAFAGCHVHDQDNFDSVFDAPVKEIWPAWPNNTDYNNLTVYKFLPKFDWEIVDHETQEDITLPVCCVCPSNTDYKCSCEANKDLYFIDSHFNKTGEINSTRTMVGEINNVTYIIINGTLEMGSKDAKSDFKLDRRRTKDKEEKSGSISNYFVNTALMTSMAALCVIFGAM